MFRKLSAFRQKKSNRDNEVHEESHVVSNVVATASNSSSVLSVADQFGSSTSSRPVLSTFSSADHLTRRPSESEPGPLGLNVVYTPENGHKADIIFIHGLGGTSRLTWSKYKNPNLFWPLTFLPLEPDICLARILTFGYNANLRKSGQVSTSVLDFAKDLLFDLKYGKDEQKEELHMGRVPLIFVVHSMGGLIVKEAYMQGQNDPEYESIIKAISAITFIATPHRGTHLAETLSRILQSSMITNSKHYVLELAKNSPTLQKLNEQFRHIAPKLDIISFYETEPTSIGLKNARVMVLEKDTSVLGYPGETSKALIADHHGVCKYDSPDDPNYITVRNVIKSLVSKIIATNKINVGTERRASVNSRKDMYDLQSALAIHEMPETDYIFHRDLWTEGTCEWVIQNASFVDWTDSTQTMPKILWLKGGPATGKSVMSSFIINTLVKSGALCQYFFMRFGDPRKRSISVLLRSLAYQLSRDVPRFSQQLEDLVGEAIDLPSASPRLLWERIFKSMLPNMEGSNPIYWVIDGLDEADDPQGVIRLLSDVTSIRFPLQILFVSRDTPSIMSAFQRLPQDLRCTPIDIDVQQDDLRYFVQRELNMPGNEEFRGRIASRVIEGAQENFLWARLAINRLSTCHKQSQVEAVLQDFPVGMEALFDRMATSIATLDSPEARTLAEKIIGYVSCSLKRLTVSGLSQALGEDESDILDLQRSIAELCSGFVSIDNGGEVSLIHQTVREYLLSDTPRPFHINPKIAHERLFLSCMACLRNKGLRAKIAKGQLPDFVGYASLYWSSHLLLAPIESEDVATELRGFMTGQSILIWIHVLSRSKQLRVLVQASKHISKYVAKVKTLHGSRDMKSDFIMQQALLESWTVDLVKIMGKFGPNLTRRPDSIYKAIPPFCPRNSAIFQQFGKGESRSLSVQGHDDWDDSLTRISLGFGAYTSSILTAGSLIAILATPGNVSIFDSGTFEELSGSPFKHGERVYSMEFHASSATFVTYGYKTTKVWNTSGECRYTIANIESRPRPLTMLLTNHGKRLLVGFDDRHIRSLNLAEASPVWQVHAELDEPELEGHFLNSANFMATNGDGSLFAVAYRGHPLSAWETEGPAHLGHCWRKRDELARGEVIDAVWHPMSPEVLGVYIEGVVFKWLPYEDVVEEIPVGASKIAISSDGNLFVTGDVHGTVKVFGTSDLGLIYQLGSQDTVLGLAFSPDSRRLYDIRGYYASAWEPNVLVRMTEQADANLETASDSISLAPSSIQPVQSAPRVGSITALAADPRGLYFGSGTEKGAVNIHDTEGRIIEEAYVSRGLLSIEHLAWSSDGKLLCFTNASKQLFVFSVSQEPTHGPITEKLFEISLRVASKGPILQILFESTSSHIIIHTQSKLHLVSVGSASISCSLDLEASECRWTVQPQDLNLVIGVAPGIVYLLHCKHFSLKAYHYDLPDLSSETPSFWKDQSSKVERVMPSSDRRHLLVQLHLRKSKSDRQSFLYFPLSAFPWTPQGEANEVLPTKVIPFCFPSHISSDISFGLSFLSQNKLVYLSKDFAISTVRIAPSPDWSLVQTTTSLQIQKGTKARTNLTAEIFALPRDWISRDCLRLSIVWPKGKSFLCPRNGEISVVRSSALV